MRSRVATCLLAAGSVVVLAWASGGYFPSDWGLVTLLFLLLALGVVLGADEVRLSRPTTLFAAALAGLGLWQLASAAWAGTASLPVIEAERTLLYLAAAAALLLALRETNVPALLDGIAGGAAVVALYSLGTRLAPGALGGAYDPSSGYQLAKPIGYWNALGLLAATGLVLAVAAGVRGGRVEAAFAAAAAVPLAACLYFTFSRGSLLALGAALCVLVGVGRARTMTTLHAALLLAGPAVGVVLASRAAALTTAGATLQTAQAQGYRLAWQLGCLALVAAVLAPVWPHVLRRVPSSRVGCRALAVVAVVVAVGTAGALVARAGGPAALAERAHAAFVEEPPSTTSGYERRLLSASGNGRAAYWHVAWAMARRDPLLGEGAGSFARAWARERPVPNEALDAHNLYLEVLAELGIPGLALLLMALAAPFTVLGRVRSHPAAPGAAAGLTAFLVHATIDWDWEIPLLVLVAVACAASLIVLDPRRRAFDLSRGSRAAACAALGAAGALALVGHVGNRAVAASEAALARDDIPTAAAQAQRARTWMPWSAAGEKLLGEARSAAGDDGAARAALGRAARRDEGDWSVWYDIASVSNGPTRAEALTRARELNPLSVEVDALLADEGQRSSSPRRARKG